MTLKILHGDCLEKIEDLEANSIHLLISDPPYFLDGLDDSWKKGRESRSTGSVGGLPIGMRFDPKQGLALQDFMRTLGNGLARVVVPGAFMIFFSQPRLVHRMAVGLEEAGFEIRDLLAWHFTRRAQFKAFTLHHFVEKMPVSKAKKDYIKRKMQGRKTPQLRPLFEGIVLAQKPREGTFIDNWMKFGTGLIDSSASLDGLRPGTVMKVEKPNKDDFNKHLTVKPLQLIEHLIQLFSQEGQWVLDPFLGSGTSLLAARKMGRHGIGIEIDKAYCNLAYRRLEKAKEKNRKAKISKNF